MKIGTHAATGRVLDYMVAVSLPGATIHKDAMLAGTVMRGYWIAGLHPDFPNSWQSLEEFHPSEDLLVAAPLIDRFGISCTRRIQAGVEDWWCTCDPYDPEEGDENITGLSGPTRYIAAMRTLVLHLNSDGVEVPDDIVVAA